VKTVFALYLIHHFDEITEESQLLGIYSSEQKALAAVKRRQQHPTYLKETGKWYIYPIRLDQKLWSEGFIRA
jgi:hypothetical protein